MQAKEGALTLGDLVVAGAEVGGGGDEVNVEVGVVVLLEIDGVHAVAWTG